MGMEPHPSVKPLFQPLVFGRKRLPNRLVMAPMTRKFSPNGIPGPDVANYYRRRAEGGIGLIITEGTPIGFPGSSPDPSVPNFYGEDALEGWRHVAEAVHAAGSLIIPQIWHIGPKVNPAVQHEEIGFGPMDVEENGVRIAKAMTPDDIDGVVAAFAKAARDAERIGFDGVELHGAHGYLIDSFLWSVTNQRQDGYGGSIENRTRLAVEIVRAVRQAVSPDFPVVLRFSQWKTADYNARLATTPDELGRIVKPLAEAGVDFFHASTRRFWEPAFAGSPDNLATWTRRLTGKPVITVGSVGLNKVYSSAILWGAEDPKAQFADVSALVEQLRQEKFDLVALGRALLSEPEWGNKVREGRFSEIRSFDEAALDHLVV